MKWAEEKNNLSEGVVTMKCKSGNKRLMIVREEPSRECVCERGN